MRTLSVLACGLAFVVPAAHSLERAARPIEWVDVHVHAVVNQRAPDFPGALAAALAAMNASRTRQIVLMPPPQVHAGAFDYQDFVSAAKAHGSRIQFLGGGGTLNVMIQEAAKETTVPEAAARRFEAQAEAIIAAGALGFGEITAHHFSLVPDHPYEAVAADHPLLLLLADIAARHDVVIDLHYDPVAQDTDTPAWLPSPPNPPALRANIEALERLLAHNRKAKIVWAHAGSDFLGQWTVALSRRLLGKHPNLHMSLRMGPGRAPQNHPLTREGDLKPEWLALLSDFSDRFLIGTDQFFLDPQVMRGPAAAFAQKTGMNRKRTLRFLSLLPGDLAKKIAFENAKRVYKLPD